MGTGVFILLTVAFFARSTNTTLLKPQSKWIEESEALIGETEFVIDGISRRKIISVEDLADLERISDQYVKKIGAACQEASKGPEKLNAFISIVQKQRQRWQSIETRVNSIEDQVKTAKIVPDRALLESMSSSEFENYRKELSTEGLTKMENLHPDLFKRRRMTEASPRTGYPARHDLGRGPYVPDDSPEVIWDAEPARAGASLWEECNNCYQRCRRFCNTTVIPRLCKAIVCSTEYLACLAHSGDCQF